MADNEEYRLSDVELDAIGEVMNISMGSAATAMSTILDTKVNITIPNIEFVSLDEFTFSFLEPVVGVAIKYVEGIDGANVLLLRRSDVAKIVGHLLSTEPADESEELDEIGQSAICEIMNQMMGSAASALATFLGKSINISPPEIINKAREEDVKDMFAIRGESLVSIKFNLNIEGLIESEFLSAMEPQLAKEIVETSFGVNQVPEDAMPAAPPPQAPAAAPVAAAAAAAPVAPMPQAAPQGAVYASAPPPVAGAVPYGPPPGAYPPQGGAMPGRTVATAPYAFRSFDESGAIYGQDNLDLVMTVPIQISVELGRTKRKIKDIADLGVGNIVELDRQAGDHVDVIANGKLIAKGDVVVVDDNYSVRITEIIRQPEEFI